MNQTMTDKPATPPTSLPVAQEERSHNDEMMDKIRPYLATIGVVFAIGLLGLIAATLLINNSLTAGSKPSQALASAQSEFAISGNVDRLTQVADEFPGTKAAAWALQTSGDYQLRKGIDTLREDRVAGFELVEKSKDLFQRVIDAPASAKTALVQQASVFSMAYASETLGQFEDAKKFYSQLVEEAPNSHFAKAAKRGALRAGNPAFVAAFEEFKNFEELGDAPGPNVPERPEIDFPEFELPTGGKVKEEDATTDATESTDTTDAANPTSEEEASDAAAADVMQDPAETAAELDAGEEATEEAAEAVTEAVETTEKAVEAVESAVQETAADVTEAVAPAETVETPQVEDAK